MGNEVRMYTGYVLFSLSTFLARFTFLGQELKEKVDELQ
jgi:hypothetical protein